MKCVTPGVSQRIINEGLLDFCKQNYQFQECGYPTIVAAGKNINDLVYFEPHSVIKKGQLVLVDFSILANEYNSDLTTVFPANGKFTVKQKQIYDLVLEANRRVIQESKPGVWWVDMHLMAERYIMQGLQKLGVIKREANIDALQEQGLGNLFFPEGLGHFVGLDLMDVGSYLKHTPKRSDKINLKNMFHSRYLEPGMVNSVEPGCYFNLQRFNTFDTTAIDKDAFNQYAEDVVGVRVEDLIVITARGCEMLIPSDLPRTTADIEKFMKSSS